MIRLLIILIIFVSGYGSLFYFFNNAGNLSLVLGMWQLSIPIVQFLFVFITFLVLLILFSYAFTKLFIYPRAAYMRYKLSNDCLLYTSPSPRDATLSRMPSSA